MTAFAALLRAVNVGGTGKLPMTELTRLCEEAGYAKVKTFIASGNVVFTTNLSEARVKEALERALEGYAGKRIDVYVRTADELAQVIRDNSFSDRPANRTLALFLDEAPPHNAVATAKGRADEEIALGKREIYVFYPSGIADSKLRFPAVKGGTSRNMNTVARLAAMMAGL